jgi:hypothetical protein
VVMIAVEYPPPRDSIIGFQKIVSGGGDGHGGMRLVAMKTIPGKGLRLFSGQRPSQVAAFDSGLWEQTDRRERFYDRQPAPFLSMA